MSEFTWADLRRLTAEMRRATGLTEAEYARRVGWEDAETVTAWEAGEACPTFPVLVRMLDVLAGDVILN